MESSVLLSEIEKERAKILAKPIPFEWKYRHVIDIGIPHSTTVLAFRTKDGAFHVYVSAEYGFSSQSILTA